MRGIRRVFLSGAVGIGLVLATVATPAGASEGYDFAKQWDFWKGSAQAADITVYAPSRKDVERVGLEVSQPPTTSSLQMLCAGQWNVIANFYGDMKNEDASLTFTQAPGTECMDDVGASDAPQSPWSFTAFGNTFKGFYQGCAGTGEGQPEPALAQCAVANRFYVIAGELPAVSGSAKTAVRLETAGMSRAQIRRFVRSLSVVR